MSARKADKAFVQKARMRVRKAVDEFGLIAPGDRIVVGLSGGKDSAVLLDALAWLRQMDGYGFELAAVHVDLTDVPYQVEDAILRSFTARYGIDYVRLSDDRPVVNGPKHPCFYCAWNRRKRLFQWAADHGYGTVALGHHADDFAETLLMNMIYHGEYAAFKPRQSMFDGQLHIVRPLFYLSDHQTQRYAQLIRYTPPPYNCPFAEDNHRERFRSLMRQIKQMHPKALENMLRAARNLNTDYLPPPEAE